MDIDSAVDEARKATSRDISFTSNSERSTVEFDKALTAEQTSVAGGKAGVRVLSLAKGGGEIKKNMKNQTVSRVQFGLYIDSMTKSEAQSNSRDVDYNDGPIFAQY